MNVVKVLTKGLLTLIAVQHQANRRFGVAPLFFLILKYKCCFLSVFKTTSSQEFSDNRGGGDFLIIYGDKIAEKLQ